MVKVALVAFAAVIFLLIAVNALTDDAARWAAGAIAAFMASFLPPPSFGRKTSP